MVPPGPSVAISPPGFTTIASPCWPKRRASTPWTMMAQIQLMLPGPADDHDRRDRRCSPAADGGRRPGRAARRATRSAFASPSRSTAGGCLILATALQFLVRRTSAMWRNWWPGSRPCWYVSLRRPLRQSLRYPDLHGITDQLIALALDRGLGGRRSDDGGAAAAGRDARHILASACSARRKPSGR